MANKKQTSPGMASVAAHTLRDPNASGIQRSLAASALAQSGNGNEPSAAMAHLAGKALQRTSAADLTKELAASVLAQADPKRN